MVADRCATVDEPPRGSRACSAELHSLIQLSGQPHCSEQTRKPRAHTPHRIQNLKDAACNTGCGQGCGRRAVGRAIRRPHYPSHRPLPDCSSSRFVGAWGTPAGVRPFLGVANTPGRILNPYSGLVPQWELSLLPAPEGDVRARGCLRTTLAAALGAHAAPVFLGTVGISVCLTQRLEPFFFIHR